MSEQNKSFWSRLNFKYRLMLVDENNMAEAWHTRISWLRLVTYFVLIFIIAVLLISVLIIYTPVRNLLPGYSASIRSQLVEQSLKVDSLGTELEVQRQYTNVLRGVLSGETTSDTIQAIDTMQLYMREQLLEAKNEITEAFKAEYEEREKDNLQLFANVRETAPTLTFFSPQQGNTITSVLTGHIIMVNREIDNSYTVVVEHPQYISIYRGLKKVFKPIGTALQAAEAIGVMEDGEKLRFELWQGGKQIDPSSVIAF